MPRVTFVKKAQKAQGTCGKCDTKIAIGDSYRWWKFRYGGRRVRCAKPECAPKASDLTQSAFYSQLYSIQDALDAAIDARSVDDLRAVGDDLRSLGDECSDSRSNMPDSLQYSETGELLETRSEECSSKADEIDSAADELEGITTDWQEYAEEEGLEKEEDESDEDFQQRVTEAMDAAIDEAWGNLDLDLSID